MKAIRSFAFTFAWLIAFGLTAAVANVLNQFPALDAKIKTAIGGVVTAMRLPALVLLLGGALALSLLMLGTPSPVFAESPQPPYTYALVKCSGLPVDILILAEQDFDTAYGWTHQLTTPAQWSGSYEARVNEFASLLGCPQVLQDGQLTRWFEFYSPTYTRYLRGAIP